MKDLTEIVGRRITDILVDSMILRLARDRYPENLFEIISTTMKMTPLRTMEIVLRAEKGEPIGRPFGSVCHNSPWEKLMFNPVHLVRLPVEDKRKVRTDVVLGPKAERPLKLKIPILIAGMSYGGALSKETKIALAKASTMAGTATNTGEGAFIPEVRDVAEKYIYQYHRGTWPHGNKKDFYTQADMIEIQVGQGAQASSPQVLKSKNIDEEFREIFGLEETEDMVINSRLKEVRNPEDLKKLVTRLKEETQGVPIAYKFAASHYLEEEMEIAIEAGVDVIVIDGAEAGTHAGSPLLEDDFGLPTFHSLVRAADYLIERGLKDRVSLIASGGLTYPGHFLKAMALGADAVYIGSAALMALIHTQMVETSPWEPPTELVFYKGKLKEKLNIELAAKGLYNYLKSCVQEMVLGAVTLGKESLSAVNRSDLCALDLQVAEITGVELAYRPKPIRFGKGMVSKKSMKTEEDLLKTKKEEIKEERETVLQY